MVPALIHDAAANDDMATLLEFPPVSKQHILNCSYHSWYKQYKALVPSKTRLVPLTPPFLEYLRADGIILPRDEDPTPVQSDDDSAYVSASDAPDEDDDDDDVDIAAPWRALHKNIKDAIAELGGNVVPKLNWSAPKDSTYMNANTMECKKPSEIFLLLKSSDFITHDLEHAFDDCGDHDTQSAANGDAAVKNEITNDDIPYHLVLRKAKKFVPSVEFRCFVRNRKLLCLCQRDLNHYPFLFKIEVDLTKVIKQFFEMHLRDTFPDEHFVFDVYVPQRYDRAWLVDINPWAPRTDPILFSWQELLTMPDQFEDEPEEEEEPAQLEQQGATGIEPAFVRFSVDPAQRSAMLERAGITQEDLDAMDDEDDYILPELRLVHKDDPEAHSFATPQYSAHKMPKDLVEASQNGEGMIEFAKEWNKHLERAQEADAKVESSDDED